MDKKKINTYETVLPRIYAYTTPGVTYHEGWLKIGYTATQTVDERIKQINHTGWIIYSTEWIHRAPFDEILNRQMTDKDFHKFLTGRYKIPRAADDLEWFRIDAATAEKYLEEFCAGKTFREPSPPDETAPYALREEQKTAVAQTSEYWLNDKNPREFLWNAKPRFGKNLAVYEFIKEYAADKVLIVTNRPAIANAWHADFKKFYAQNPDSRYIFRATTALKLKPFDGELEDGQRLIAFISLQDLKGAETFGGKTKKLDWIKNFHWDILIVDESHEGVATVKTQCAFNKITKDFTLYLSGTPFKAIASGDFRADQIFNWSYLDEQKKKRDFTAEPNPYADLPRMNLFSYKLSDMLAQKISAGENVDYAFDLNEFFRTDKGKFVYEDDVKKFLDALTTSEKFPFSTPELRAELRHTFWLLQYVESAKALARLLQQHPVFSEYEIILAAGDGKLDEHDENLNAKSFQRVTEAIACHDKTITLSVGQLTTGVTIPQWTAVLMLSEMKSAAAYIQAAFRAQNPHRDGNRHKTNCYVFDFNPARALEIYSEYAASIAAESSDAEKITELLNFFPVLAEDSAGKMVPLDAEAVMSLPQTIRANQIIDSGFMSNLIFDSDKIIRVFGAPKSVEQILNKIPRDDSPAKKKAPEKIQLSNFQADPDAQTIDDKTEEIFGRDKRPPRPNVPPSEIASEIVDAVKKKYPLNKAQSDALAKKIDRQLADDTSAENIARVQRETVQLLENKKAADAKRQKESDIRARLRGFARTIPSFLMAYGDRSLTLENFDSRVDADIFEEVTGITLDDFRFLRDGGSLHGEHFDGGLFNSKTFNAAIQEFLNRKDELADYFTGEHDKDIFDFIPPQRTNQIFTPKAAVVQIVDALQRQYPAAFNDPRQKFIDPCMKSGMFIAEVVRRLFLSPALKNFFPDDTERLTHILTRQVFGFAPSEIIRRISTNYIFGNRQIPRSNFVTADLSQIIQSNQLDAFLKNFFSIRVTVLNTNRVKKFGEVFTPPEIVNEMLDAPELADIWKDPFAKILEPSAGRGAFLTAVLERKLARKLTHYQKFAALASVYAVELQLDNLDAAKDALAQTFISSFNYFSSADKILMRQILDANIVQGDIITTQNYHQLPITFYDWKIDPAGLVMGADFGYAYLSFDMKFAIILGNPPYQLDTKGDNKTFAAPVYHKFLQSFWERCKRVLMIHPARCLFRAGGTPKDFIDKFLSDDHIKIIRYEPDSKKIFPDLDIKGGIAISFRDADVSFGKIGVFIPFPELKSIFLKVTTRKDFKPLSKIIFGRSQYRLTEKFIAENPTAPFIKDRRNDFFKTSVFNYAADYFFDDKPNDGAEYFQVLGLENLKRATKWIRRDYVDICENKINFFKFKVFIPEAYGAGALGESGPTMLVGSPLVGSPLVGCTQTFITLGAFDSGAEAESALKYVKTKFARALLGVLKVTQHNPPETWRYVPQQDFSAGSDVPWGLSVAEVDAYLYEKYELTAEERAFIEANVKAMN